MSSPYRFILVSEALADAQIARELADRVLCSQVDWAQGNIDGTGTAALSLLRSWSGVQETAEFLRWGSVKALAAEHGLKAHGHFDGEPGAADARAARRALLLIEKLAPNASAIVLVRDGDDQPSARLEGLNQARREHRSALTVVVGLANPKREAWVLAGFEPSTPEERERLATATRELGFDPCLHAHELTAKERGSKRNAQDLLEGLINRDRKREADCWQAVPLQLLAQRGRRSGLAGFLAEVEERLVPLLRGEAEEPA